MIDHNDNVSINKSKWNAYQAVSGEDLQEDWELSQRQLQWQTSLGNKYIMFTILRFFKKNYEKVNN